MLRLMRPSVLVLAVVAACAPPPSTPPATDTGGGGDVDDGRPRFEVLWPPQERTLTGCAMFVLDIDNLELVEPAMDPPPEKVDGQGHWHVTSSSSYTPCGKPFCLVSFEGVADGPQPFAVSLVNNDHSAILDDDGDPVEQTVLIDVVGGECTTGTPSSAY
jgi:hypothetical protein